MNKRTAAWMGALLWSGAALAAPTKSVRVTTYQELAEGQVNGVLLSSQGEARAGFAARRLALPALSDDSVRAMATAADGTVYLGTGGDAPSVLVYKGGPGRAGEGPKRLAKLDAATWVTALCPLEGAGQPPGQVLAATAQDGRIFRVSADGKSEVVAQVEAEHVWAMVRDGVRGVTYVAAGPGALYALEDAALLSKGAAAKKPARARKLFASEARQFLSLHRGDDGALYFGTADDAVLYRLDPQSGTGARAVQDFAGNEVRAIAHYKDVLYVAVNDMQRGDTAGRGIKLVTPPAGSAPGVKPTPPSSSTAPTNPSPTEKKGKGALYRIDPSGRVEQLHAIVDGFFNALTVDADGNLFAAASTPGGRSRVYLVAPSGATAALPVVYTALEVKESDALALGTAGRDLLLLGTGNSGAFYLLPLHDKPPADASYLSKAFYAQAPSRWGSLRFSGQNGLRVETRSGNLAKPDDSWSPWQPLKAVARRPAGDEQIGQRVGEQIGKISSPPGRYLQVRVLFAAQAVLRDFTFYYQPVNLRPRVTEILIGEDPTGQVARGVRMPGSLGSLRPRTSAVKLRWKVENPDEDDLNYRLYLRPAGTVGGAVREGTTPDAGWLRIGGPDPNVPLLRPELEWNTESVADGLYELKVVVSDERSNPPELALTHELISSPFLIDNKRPELKDLSFDAATGTLSGRAIDSTSSIAELGYSVDGGDFYPLSPRDGVLDDLSEDFSVRLPRLSPGLHTVLVRTCDAAENATTAQILVSAPGSTAASSSVKP